jgi:hypothetical protein
LRGRSPAIGISMGHGSPARITSVNEPDSS